MGIVIALVFGLIYGSFLNVVILRFDDWRSIISGRSECPNCHEKLRWYDLVPVVSYASLRGRCRYCRQPISWQYPLVELATGGMVAASYWLVFTNGALSLGWQILAFMALVLVIGSLVAMFCHDLREMMIPDFFAYVFLLAAFVFSLVYYQNVLDSLYGALIGFLPIGLLVYPSRGRWMGEGDVKLAAGLGLLAGFPNAIVFMAVAFIGGGLFGVLLLAGRRAKLTTAVPFGPFLIIGGLVALFWGAAIIRWYLGGIGL